MKNIEKLADSWSVPVDVQDIPEAGLHLVIEAQEAECAALAKLANVREVISVCGEFEISRRGAGVHVAGILRAQVGQICVVTLEPIESEIRETIDLLFLPGTASAPAVQITPGEEDPPEPLIDNKVDLGAISTEFLLLGIDPYPRKTGVEFAAPQAEDASNHAFAGLEVLKKRFGYEQS